MCGTQPVDEAERLGRPGVREQLVDGRLLAADVADEEADAHRAQLVTPAISGTGRSGAGAGRSRPHDVVLGVDVALHLDEPAGTGRPHELEERAVAEALLGEVGLLLAHLGLQAREVDRALGRRAARRCRAAARTRRPRRRRRSGSETSGSPCALPWCTSTTPRSPSVRRSSPKVRNPWSASLNVGSLRRMARLSIDASTGPPLLRESPASVRVTSASRSVSSAGVTASDSGTASASARGLGAAAAPPLGRRAWRASSSRRRRAARRRGTRRTPR